LCENPVFDLDRRVCASVLTKPLNDNLRRTVRKALTSTASSRTEWHRTGRPSGIHRRTAATTKLPHYVDISRHMDLKLAIAALSALAQPTRLKAFRRLIRTYPEELSAGAIARFSRVPHNTMSTHLAALTRAGLIVVRRDGRTMNYSADLEGFRELIKFLMRDCCGGRAEVCAPLFAELQCCLPVSAEENAHVGPRV
jgi:ArsR family transcriptional regulator